MTQTTMINGLKYKIGLHGKAYYQLDGQWLKSNHDQAMVRAKIFGPEKTKKPTGKTAKPILNRAQKRIIIRMHGLHTDQEIALAITKETGIYTTRQQVTGYRGRANLPAKCKTGRKKYA